jgi:heat shock protein HtpX
MSTLAVVLLLAALSGILMAVGALVAGRGGVLAALAVSIVMNIGGYWFSDRIVLAMYQAREVTERQAPELHAVVKDLAARAELPEPRVYIIESEGANAFATGRNARHAAVAVTTGILNILSPAELQGVLGHELSHIKNRDILISTMAATMAGAVVMLATMAKWAAIMGGAEDRGGGAIGLIATAIVAPVAATIIQMAISRSREYEADAGGAEITGKPEALAGALAKLARGAGSRPLDANPSTAHMFTVNPLAGGAIMNLFSTHPPIEKRIARLMKMASSADRHRFNLDGEVSR